MKIISRRFLLGMIVAIVSQSGFASDTDTDTDTEQCWNSQAILVEAENLEETAEHFSEVLLTIPNYAHLSEDAEALAEEASHFQEAVRTGKDCHHLRVDFHEVYKAAYQLYVRVLRAHNKYHNHHIVDDWNDMVDTYHRSLREVNKTRGRHDRTNRNVAPGSRGPFAAPYLGSTKNLLMQLPRL